MRSPPPRAHFLLHPVFAEAKSPAPVRLSCPDSVRPLGSSQSRCDSLEASGRDPNPRAARSPPQRCPLLAQARRSLLPPGAGSQAPASRRPRWPTVRKPAVAHVLSLRLDGDPGMSEVTGQTSACRGPGARAARGEAGFAKAGPPGEGAPRQEPEDNNSSWEGPVPCPPPPSLHPAEKTRAASRLPPADPVPLTESEKTGVGGRRRSSAGGGGVPEPSSPVWGWSWVPETNSGRQHGLREALAFPLWLWAEQFPASGERPGERPCWRSGAWEPPSRKSAEGRGWGSGKERGEGGGRRKKRYEARRKKCGDATGFSR